MRSPRSWLQRSAVFPGESTLAYPVTSLIVTDPNPEYDGATTAIVLVVFWGATAFVITLCALLVRRLRR